VGQKIVCSRRSGRYNLDLRFLAKAGFCCDFNDSHHFIALYLCISAINILALLFLTRQHLLGIELRTLCDLNVVTGMYYRINLLFFLLFFTACLAAQVPDRAAFSAVSTFKLVDPRQQGRVELGVSSKPLVLFVFLSPECPVCQGYAKTLNQIGDKYERQVQVIGIIPGDAYSSKEVVEFANNYHLNFRLFIDPDKGLSQYLKATVTPQVILLDNKPEKRGALLYTGAIDNWVQALGKKRLQVTEHYTEQAIGQYLTSAAITIHRTNAIGCKINDY